jgi:YaiO family outer membrane protein
MRTTLVAALVAGSVVFTAFPAMAGESSSLRGLKPPRDGLEPQTFADAMSPQAARWRTLEGTSALASGLTVPGGQLQTQRFSARDADLRIGLYQPLGNFKLVPSVGELDPLHDVMPKYAMFTQFNQALPGGWGVGLGLRQGGYNFATSNLLSLSAERYWGNFRGAYTVYSNRIEGSDVGSAHRFQVNYFYGDRNTVGLSYTSGRDIETVALPLAQPLGEVRDLTLSGRHWLSTNWALHYDVLSHEQANLNRRQGLRLGVSRSF